MKKPVHSPTRIYVLVAVMAIWGLAIGIRLYFLQVVQSADFRERAQTWQQTTDEVTPRRGVIYDRNGNELAISVKVDSVFAVPSEIKDKPRAAKLLSSLTGVASSKLLDLFSRKKHFAWVDRKISDAEKAAIERANIPGVHFQKEYRRSYPNGELAAHVLGYVNLDEQGQGGLEYKYNDLVNGEPGKVVLMIDANGNSFQRSEETPQAGANLRMTLDKTAQHIVEKELKEAALETKAEAISVVAVDPKSGAVIAMANYPTFNPNERAKAADHRRANLAIQLNYEPGSTFKIVTAAAALEEKLTTPEERIDCLMGSIVLYNHRIRDWKPFGVLSVREIMQYSSDVGMITLGLRLGDERFAGYIDRFGFGRLTDIDLPGEENGVTKPASRWSKVSVGAISMGQEIQVTPLQIVSLVSAVANGGTLYRPYLVEKIEDPRQGVTETQPLGTRVMSERTAAQLQDMLEVVVTEGTAKGSKLEGYRAAGKTGTAQKYDPATGTYSKTKHIASFAGYAPASDPEIAIVVVVDAPVGRYHGGDVAAPMFKKIAEQILRSRAVAPDVPEYAPYYAAASKAASEKNAKEAKPAKEAPKKPAAAKDAERAPADSLKAGQKPAVPGPASRNPEWKLVDMGSDSNGYAYGDVEIPDFTGKSLRQVAEEAARLGLRSKSTGSGQVVSQYPPAGSYVRTGSQIQVRFSAR